MRPVALPALLLALALAAPGCGPGFLGGDDYGWLDGRGRPVSTRSIRLRWREQLTPNQQGAYIPVERAVPALDPSADRVYAGTSAGHLWAFTASGGRVYSYEAHGGIATQPAIDAARDQLFVPTEDGVLHHLTASTGELQWRAEIGGAVSQPPVLTEDAVYVVTDDDIVVAIARHDGVPLWRFQREAPEGFYVSEHAGLTLTGSRLLAAFTGGIVVALDPADGSVLWERDLSVELEPGGDGAPRFVDVDTTPLVVEDTVYVASFAGGLFALELASGTVQWRDEELTGISSIAQATSRLLILSSGDLGVVCFDRVGREVRWRKRPPRGAPGPVVVADDLVLFGETQGGFITLALQDGQELGRVETGHGFSAGAAVADGRGFVVSNGGVLYAFGLPGSR